MKNEKKEKVASSSRKTFFRIISYISKFKFIVIPYICFSLLDSFIALIFAYLINASIDSALHNSAHLFYRNLIVTGIVVVIGIAFRYVSYYSYNASLGYIMKGIRNMAVSHLQNLKLSFIEDNHTGDLISRLTGDLNSMQGLIGDILFKQLIKISTMVMFSVYMITINWKLYLFSMILLPPVLYLSTRITKPMKKLYRQASNEVGKANSLAQDVYGGMFIVKAFNLEKEMKEKYRNQINKGLEHQFKAIHRLKWLPVFNTILWSAPFIICLVYGSYLSIHHEISPGQLPAFVYLFNYIVIPFSSLPSVISNYQSGIGKAERLFEILDQPTERADGSDFKVSGDEEVIEFKEVCYAYPSNPEKLILDHLSFQLKKGSKTALVGYSGCGKSTILKLISGFYDTYEGEIEIFGHSLKDWNLKAIRDKISLVSQDTYLFPASIYDNILAGRPQASGDEVYEAAKAANAHEFIMSLPNGYETLVGERGIKLSGGERQRISLARAFLKDASILILDEPTSALDTISETAVNHAILRLMENRTTLIVAHRLSTIKDVDEILVIDNGQLIERGTHSQLISTETHYYQLYTKQIMNEANQPLNRMERVG